MQILLEASNQEFVLEIVHFATDEKSLTSAIVDDGCPSTLAGEQIIGEYFVKNCIDSTGLERKMVKGKYFRMGGIDIMQIL